MITKAVVVLLAMGLGALAATMATMVVVNLGGNLAVIFIAGLFGFVTAAMVVTKTYWPSR